MTDTADTTAKHCDPSTIAFVSFLRSEAEAASSRAKQLWAQAEKLIQDHGLEEHFQAAKKLGRKTKRKRNNGPDHKMPKLTGYTLFMKEVGSHVRQEDPTLPAQHVVQRVAKLWNEKSEEQKQEWRAKAEEQSQLMEKKDGGETKDTPNAGREVVNAKMSAHESLDKGEKTKKVQMSEV